MFAPHPLYTTFRFLVLFGNLYSCCLWPSKGQTGLATAVSSDGLGCIPDMELSMDRANMLYSGNFAPSCCFAAATAV